MEHQTSGQVTFGRLNTRARRTWRIWQRVFAFWLPGITAGLANAEPIIRPGDRVAIVGNTFADQLRIYGYLETILLQRSGEKRVSIRNLGWAGDQLHARDRPTNFPSETSVLIAHQTDVILACFGMGESFAGQEGLPGFQSALEAFVASHRGQIYNGTSPVRLVLISPIAYENLGKLTPEWERRNHELAAYTEAMGHVASRQEIPFVDLYHPARQFMADSTAPKMTTNGIHLNAYGYWVMSRLLADRLTPGDPPWTLRIDAQSMRAESTGAIISTLERDTAGLRFMAHDKTAPMIAPPAGGKLPARAEAMRDSLAVTNLTPGDYLLTIDGEPVVAASHEHWAKGVAIDASPLHRTAEALRQAVNDKNQQFIYSWKALNQVHIVGERRSSPSGQALPAELVEFKNLADQKDKALRTGMAPQTREWRLTQTGRPTASP